jgi:squalene synthase HpnC
MPVDHYENFPVASVLLPKKLVPAVEAIYAFARSADDIADEGDALPQERLAGLAAYEAALASIGRGERQQDPMFERLAGVIAQYTLPLQPFYDLLSAFKQDVGTKSYERFDLLLDYCRRSANPVGFLMLSLYGKADAGNIRDSDAICSALQIINFLQDVAVDREKERIYIPLDDLKRFGVTSEQLDQGEANARFKEMMQFEVDRARALMLSGAPLAKRLPGRIGWELRLVVQGGLRILEAIEQVRFDVFRRRPKLKMPDWLLILWRALRM